jgi:hypothetical protein
MSDMKPKSLKHGIEATAQKEKPVLKEMRVLANKELDRLRVNKAKRDARELEMKKKAEAFEHIMRYTSGDT